MRYVVPYIGCAILLLAAGSMLMVAIRPLVIAFGKAFIYLIHLIY